MAVFAAIIVSLISRKRFHGALRRATRLMISHHLSDCTNSIRMTSEFCSLIWMRSFRGAEEFSSAQRWLLVTDSKPKAFSDSQLHEENICTRNKGSLNKSAAARLLEYFRYSRRMKIETTKGSEECDPADNNNRTKTSPSVIWWKKAF